MSGSGEFWERNGLAMDQELPQRPTLPEPSRTIKAIIHETIPNHKPEPNWKPLYPEVIEPSQDLVAPKGPQSVLVESKVAITNDNSPSGIPPQETVQPLEVLRPQGRIHETRIALDNVLAPAGQIKSSVADFHHEYLGLRSGWKGCHSTMFPNVRQASFQENQSFSSNPDGNSYIAFPNPTDCVLEASSKSVSKSNSEGESDIDHENGATRL